MAILESHGADEVVTGSCHLLKLKNGTTILVDCGMYQGKVEHRNWEPFGFDPAKVDVLLVTHAHLDHVGRIPKLVKEGFRGTIVATEATFELANVVLLDSAKLMEEEYRTLYRKAQRRGEEKKVRPPLYTVEDVQNVWLLPTTYAQYDKTLTVAKGVKAVYRNAGHILGSAFIELTYREGPEKHKIVFSGDLGNLKAIVMPKQEQPKTAPHLVIESTYGDRNHRPMKESIIEFKKAVKSTLLNRGNVVIPSFAIERTQDILCILKQMYLDGELPTCKVFLDSPMAIRAKAIVMPKQEQPKTAPHLVIESTYGDRNHRPMKESIIEFKKAVKSTLLNRGNVVIPSFAIERTQDILCILKQMYLDGELPTCKVFLDSPMAIRATSVFDRYVSELSPQCQEFHRKDGDVFDFPGLHLTVDVEDSKRINEIDHGAIIIAGSGMCTGGRILHHFKHQIWDRRNCVIFVGYQAEGSLGREIVDGARWIKIYHEKVRVKAKIYTINGFSAHADQNELIRWMKGMKELGDIFLVHGELDKQLVLKKVIKKKLGKKAVIVKEGVDYKLDASQAKKIKSK